MMITRIVALALIGAAIGAWIGFAICPAPEKSATTQSEIAHGDQRAVAEESRGARGVSLFVGCVGAITGAVVGGAREIAVSPGRRQPDDDHAKTS
jgi:hypothetical protein